LVTSLALIFDAAKLPHIVASAATAKPTPMIGIAESEAQIFADAVIKLDV